MYQSFIKYLLILSLITPISYSNQGKVKHLLDISGLEVLLTNFHSNIANMFLLISKLEKKPEKINEKLAEKYRTRLRETDYYEHVLNKLSSELNNDEIDKLISFYESDLGQKLTSHNEDIDRAIKENANYLIELFQNPKKKERSQIIEKITEIVSQSGMELKVAKVTYVNFSLLEKRNQYKTIDEILNSFYFFRPKIKGDIHYSSYLAHYINLKNLNMRELTMLKSFVSSNAYQNLIVKLTKAIVLKYIDASLDITKDITSDR